MRLLLTLTDRNVYGTEGLSNSPCRRTVRAVLRDARGNIALLYIGKFSAYTLPGGGIEEGEDMDAALSRELQEETGCKSRVVAQLGYIEENRARHDVVTLSYGYLADVDGGKGDPDMTREEIEEDTHVQWHPLDKAIELIEGFRSDDYRAEFWRRRDLALLGAAREVW